MIRSSSSNYCIYPIGNADLNFGKNPYIDNLKNTMDQSGKTVINKSDFTLFGIFTLLKYLFVADVFIFNWLESLQEKRFGKLQSVFLPFLMILLRLFGKKIIVIFHNKYAHNGDGFFSRLNIFSSIVLSSKVLTHAREGKAFLIQKFGRLINKTKVNFIYHPVYSSEILKLDEKDIEYDYIIWGMISPYKGIYEFLNFIKNNKKFQKKRILICGKVSSKDFHNKLLEFNLENVKIIDAFITEKRLKEYISLSGAVLFVYASDSVLSSGSLTKSLNYGKPIIGPLKGSFKDLYEEGLISCFSSYDEIFLNGFFYDKNKNKNFLNVNTWVKLIDQFI